MLRRPRRLYGHDAALQMVLDDDHNIPFESDDENLSDEEIGELNVTSATGGVAQDSDSSDEEDDSSSQDSG